MPGPTSTKRVTPAARNACTSSWKRTASRTWVTQYSGEVTRSDTIGKAGSRYSIDAATSRKASSIGSISGEWNACEVARRFTRTSRARSCSAMAVTASSRPEITTERGPFTAAIATPSDQQRQHLGLRRADRIHRTAGRQLLHQTTARADQAARVRKREHPGDVRRGQLADRVPGHEIRAHTPGFQQPEQRHLEREQRRLGSTGLIDQLIIELDVEVRAHLIEGGGEDRIGGIQLPAHASPLRTLAAEQERRLTIGRAAR